MRHKMLVIAVLLVTGFSVSCGLTDERAEVEPELSGAAEEQLDEAIKETQATAPLEKAKRETKEAVQALQGYAYAQRAEFVGNMTKGLLEIQAELDRLSAKIDSSSGAVKVDAKAKLDAVRAKWSEAKRQLDRAESTTESSWGDVQGGFNKSYGELQAAFDEARQRLIDEIEP